MASVFLVQPRENWNYKALALGKIPNWGWELKDFKSICLVEVADAFNWNLIRTSTFALMPAWIALEAIREQLWFDHATVKAGRKIDPRLSEYAGIVFSEEMADEYDGLVKEHRSISDKELKKLLQDIGIDHIENHISTSKGLAVGVEIVFESVIRESWTAFEDLARELWAVTLDNDDGTIQGRIVGKTTRKNPSKNVKPIFSVRTHPGSYQVETRLVIFQSIEEIKRLYDLAFPHSAKQLFDDVEGGYIYALSAFQNVLTHTRGRVDREFLNKLSAFPEFKDIPEGDYIAPDGETVRRMRDAAMIIGRKLVELADAELQRQNPDNSSYRVRV